MELGTYPFFFLPFFAFPFPCTFFGLPTLIPWLLSDALILGFFEVVVSASLVDVARFLVLGGGDSPRLWPLLLSNPWSGCQALLLVLLSFGGGGCN